VNEPTKEALEAARKIRVNLAAMLDHGYGWILNDDHMTDKIDGLLARALDAFRAARPTKAGQPYDHERATANVRSRWPSVSPVTLARCMETIRACDEKVGDDGLCSCCREMADHLAAAYDHGAAGRLPSGQVLSARPESEVERALKAHHSACRTYAEALLPRLGSPEEKMLMGATHWPAHLAAGALRQEVARTRAALLAAERAAGGNDETKGEVT